VIFVVVTTNFPAMRDSVNQTTDTEVVLLPVGRRVKKLSRTRNASTSQDLRHAILSQLSRLKSSVGDRHWPFSAANMSFLLTPWKQRNKEGTKGTPTFASLLPRVVFQKYAL